MSRGRVLQTGPLLPWLEQCLLDEFDMHRLDREPDPGGFLCAHGQAFTALVTASWIGASATLQDSLPALRVISNFGVGLDKIDLDSAAARGIAVGYTPDVLNDCVADLAMALMLDVARRTPEADRFVRAGAWAAGNFGQGRRVSGAKLGIVGMGRIGHTIARRARGFDMDIRYHARRPVPEVPWAHEPSLLELARWCEFLVVIVAGGADTHHLINAQVLHALGPHGYLVNVSRGTVVDEPALIKALQSGQIAGAGLDVFEHEPQVPTALMTLNNVVLAPHIASNTRETRRAMAERVLGNLRGFLREGRLISSAPLPGAHGPA